MLLHVIYVVHKQLALHVCMGIMEIHVLHVYLHVKIVVLHQFVKAVLMDIILIQELALSAHHHAMIVRVQVFVNHV